MTALVRSIRLRTEAARITAAAACIRVTNPDHTDLADLLEAVAWGCSHTPPALTEQETWRWTRAVVTARRIADRWATR